MAKTKTKKEEGIDIIEDPDALVSKAEEFFSNTRNRNLVFAIGGVIAAVVAGFLIYKILLDNQNEEAQREMFQAVYYFEADSLGRALNGDGINYGFLQIIEDYSGTDAANLASFYSGATYLKLGDYNNAIRYLEDFSGADFLVQARAYALIGDSNMELENFSEAAANYQKAADHKPNKEFTPGYLQKLAVAHEANGDYSGAAAAFDKIINKYVDSPLLQEAKKQKARLEGLAAE